MQVLKTVLLIVAQLSVSMLASFGQSPSPSQSGTPLPTAAPLPSATALPTAVPLSPVPQATATPAPDATVEILKAQLESAKYYNDKILQTVYWSIGLSTTIFLFVLGISSFNAYRLRQEDKKTLLGQIDERFNKAKLSIEKRANEAGLSLQNQYDTDKNNLTKSVDSNISAIRKRLDEEIETVTNKSESSLKSALSKIEADIIEIQHTLTVNEGEMWANKGVGLNMLRTMSRAVNLAVTLGREYLIETDLDKMIKYLSDDKSFGPSAVEPSNYYEVLEKIKGVPEKYAGLKQQMVASMEKRQRK